MTQSNLQCGRKKNWLSDGKLTRIYLIYITNDVELWVAKSDIVRPPALRQWYFNGEKFKNRIKLLVDERHFLNKF